MSVTAPAPTRSPARPARAVHLPHVPAIAGDRVAHAARALPRPRRLSAGGLVWLLVLASLLGGIVALNVAVLRSSMDVSKLAANAQSVQQANRGLTAQVAALTTAYRIDRAARRLGMVQRTPGAGDHLSLYGRGRTVRAFTR